MPREYNRADRFRIILIRDSDARRTAQTNLPGVQRGSPPHSTRPPYALPIPVTGSHKLTTILPARQALLHGGSA